MMAYAPKWFQCEERPDSRRLTNSESVGIFVCVGMCVCDMNIQETAFDGKSENDWLKAKATEIRQLCDSPCVFACVCVRERDCVFVNERL